jgi:hypothetical protein
VARSAWKYWAEDNGHKPGTAQRFRVERRRQARRSAQLASEPRRTCRARRPLVRRRRHHHRRTPDDRPSRLPHPAARPSVTSRPRPGDRRRRHPSIDRRAPGSPARTSDQPIQHQAGESVAAVEDQRRRSRCGRPTGGVHRVSRDAVIASILASASLVYACLRRFIISSCCAPRSSRSVCAKVNSRCSRAICCRYHCGGCLPSTSAAPCVPPRGRLHDLRLDHVARRQR